jgi:hypothetical protein
MKYIITSIIVMAAVAVAFGYTLARMLEASDDARREWD